MDALPVRGSLPLLIGGIALLVVLLLVIWWRRRSSDKRASKKAHDAAQKRDPPVEIGETYEFGITDFSTHHSGAKNAVGKVEGFVLFVEGIPDDLSKGDVIEAKVLSFNDGRTSADATYVG